MYQNLHILSLFTKKKNLHIFYPVLRSTRNANDQWVIQFDVLWKSWCCRHEDSYNELTVLSFYEIKIDQKVRNLSKQQKTIWSACEVKIEVKKGEVKIFHLSFDFRTHVLHNEIHQICCQINYKKLAWETESDLLQWSW